MEIYFRGIQNLDYYRIVIKPERLYKTVIQLEGLHRAEILAF